MIANKEMTGKDTEAIIPDPSAREKALNFLLGVGLLKTLVDSSRRVSFRAVTKGELVVYVSFLFFFFMEP
jgi:DNA-directed RNA polymerase III subunit RPC6